MNRFMTDCVAPVLLAAAAMLLVAGCGRQEPASAVYTDRKDDPAYRSAIKGHIESERAAADRVGRLRAEAQRLRALAAKKLGEGAMPEQIDAELAAHPGDYPGWKHVSAQLAEAEKARDKAVADARAAVRDRILKERADRAAVKDGKAVPIESGKK